MLALSHCLSFVPADSATLGIVDKSPTCSFSYRFFLTLFGCSLHSRVYSGICVKSNLPRFWDKGHDACPASVAYMHIPSLANHLRLTLQVQSAFMIDLAQVSLALRNCTSRSLVILDEFGKGTLSTGSSFLLIFASYTFARSHQLKDDCMHHSLAFFDLVFRC